MIERLTEAQIAQFPRYVQEWTARGLSCEPLDVERAKAAAVKAYAAVGLKAPSRWVVCDSPLSGAITASILKSHTESSVGDSVWDSVWASVGDSVRDSVRASVGASVWASVGDSVGDSVYGAHDAGWVSFYAYMRDELGLECVRPIDGLIELADCCGWWIPYADCCILQHRHCELHRDEQGRLHNDRGMAVKYRDGWGVYAIHGERLPEEQALSPERLLLSSPRTPHNE